MHNLLLSLIALSNPMACEDSIEIINGIAPSVQYKSELVETIKMNTEEGCDWDAQLTEGTV